jgi:hypothetical protein
MAALLFVRFAFQGIVARSSFNPQAKGLLRAPGLTAPCSSVSSAVNLPPLQTASMLWNQQRLGSRVSLQLTPHCFPEELHNNDSSENLGS